MPAYDTSEFVLLSKIIDALKDKEYYQTFAKTIAMTNNSGKPIPSDDEVVAEMFHYFIQTDLLDIFHKGSQAGLKDIEAEINRKVLENDSAGDEIDEIMNSIRDEIWDNEIYIRISELKRLYANKCIVFPNSLLAELSK